MSKSQLATETTTKRGTTNENGRQVRNAPIHSTQSSHSRDERWEYDPEWTPEQQSELENKKD